MQMKDIANEIKQLFEIDNISDMGEKIMQIVLSDDHQSVYDKYLQLVENTDRDWLREIYQFFLADRGEGSNQQDFTPQTLAKLVANLTPCAPYSTVYDCCSGSGSLTIEKWKTDKTLNFICEELDGSVIPFLLFNLAVRKINAVVINGNVLTQEQYAVYRVTHGVVKKLDGFIFTHSKYDACISNPPFNIKWEPPQNDLFNEDVRFKECMPPASNANYAFILHMMAHSKEGAPVATILPCGVMSSKYEKKCRQYLVDNNFLNNVILAPNKMFASTDISTCILLANANTDKVSFIDTRQTHSKEIREQRGEGDKSHTERIYKKEFAVYSADDINKILSAVKGETIAGLSAHVDTGRIRQEDYFLNPSRYIEFISKEDIHRPYADIISDLHNVMKEQSAVKITMNETICREIGWKEIADLQIKSVENAKSMNEGIIRLLKCEPLPEKAWLVTSKRAGEIKFENTSKNGISHLFIFFMQFVKQHIYYLNQQENIYLAELRDALLPDLMSGKIDVADLKNKCFR